MRGVAKYIWFFLFIAFVGGFLLGDVSGLLGRSPVTPTTAVAKVNGDEILYLTWQNLSLQLASEQERRTGRSLNLDERQQIENQAFDQLVSDVLLQQEYEKRGIRVTDAEIREAALTSPPPEVYQNPSFQTDGRFDPAKYQRFISSPIAKQQGIGAQLENYYRSELPKQKLFSQLVSEAWVSDERLFRMFRDERDSATVRYVALRPTPAQVEAAQVADADARRFYEQNEDRWERPGRAVVSVISLSRIPTATDTAAVADRLRALRAQITSGAISFEDAAKRESEDTISGPQGGDLGRGVKGRFVAEFETAAFALRAGQISEPVKTTFGWHLIQATERKGDTLALRHILYNIRQNDSSATATDRRADQLSAIAGGATEPEKFDSAASTLALLVTQLPVQEGQTAMYAGRQVGGIAGWAFSGLAVGETSDLIDDDQGYYLVRLDSLQQGGKQPFEAVKDEILQVLKSRKAAEGLIAQGEALVADARTNGLEAAATKAGLTAELVGPFTRLGFVPGLGYYNEAIGAAFSVPVGGVGMARTEEGVIVMQVVSRAEASRTAFDQQKAAQRDRTVQAFREQKVRMFLDNLRREASITDRRKAINASLRRQTVEGQIL
jgi:peptidyl-prolyl cis-trans isomerase D